MATPALNSLQSLVAEYGAFWQSWSRYAADDVWLAMKLN
jgi:hypothetical protein